MNTVSTVHLVQGEQVYTSEVKGEDFGLPLVEPNHNLRNRHVRTVRSVRRAHGGRVVRFMDGTKTEPLNGRTVWLIAGTSSAT